MILNQLAPPCDSKELDSMLHTLDIILAHATNKIGPVEVVRMLREKADCIEAISKRLMH